MGVVFVARMVGAKMLGIDTWLRCQVDPNTQVIGVSTGAQRNKLRRTVASHYACPIPL
jgi:hypothetical protein